jgi:prepilin-type N-terminal cleavage/methylation domain-containing protein
MTKRGFTLAEVMITLTVIGIITAVIVPVAISNKPDENIMKFKKGHNTLYQVVSTLVNSDKYYCNGDLFLRADCNTVINGDHEGDNTYLCKMFADVLSVKSVNCNESEFWDGVHTVLAEDWEQTGELTGKTLKEYADEYCKNVASSAGAEIIASDGTIYFRGTNKKAHSDTYFYLTWDHNGVQPTNYCNTKTKINGNSQPCTPSGFYYTYRPFCMDVDGIGKGEDPFGYGIRVDGKIMTGKRADEWLSKNLQGEDN